RIVHADDNALAVARLGIRTSGTGNDYDGVSAACTQQPYAAARERLAGDDEERLRTPEPAAAASSKQYARHALPATYWQLMPSARPILLRALPDPPEIAGLRARCRGGCGQSSPSAAGRCHPSAAG